ncbi:MAG: hypothetical protein ACYTKD_02365 [Planctomycetota bacterium]|jgi:hypothetical protein
MMLGILLLTACQQRPQKSSGQLKHPGSPDPVSPTESAPSAPVSSGGEEATGQSDAPVSSGRISKARAVAIARSRLAESPHSSLFNAKVFFATYNTTKDVFNVDFRNAGRMGDEILPGMWGAGFLVVVDAQTGKIESANGYKR